MGFSTKISMRRSTRVQVRVPVAITGMLPDGESFSEQTYVLTVSKFGARLKSNYPLSPGMEIRVKPMAGIADTLCRVVWAEGREAIDSCEAGIQYMSGSNLFGVVFPE